MKRKRRLDLQCRKEDPKMSPSLQHHLPNRDHLPQIFHLLLHALRCLQQVRHRHPCPLYQGHHNRWGRPWLRCHHDPQWSGVFTIYSAVPVLDSMDLTVVMMAQPTWQCPFKKKRRSGPPVRDDGSKMSSIPANTHGSVMGEHLNLFILFISTFVVKHEKKIKSINNIKSVLLSQQDLEGRKHSHALGPISLFGLLLI